MGWLKGTGKNLDGQRKTSTYCRYIDEAFRKIILNLCRRLASCGSCSQSTANGLNSQGLIVFSLNKLRMNVLKKIKIEKGLIFMKMDSNTILITGGTSGIGFELALAPSAWEHRNYYRAGSVQTGISQKETVKRSHISV